MGVEKKALISITALLQPGEKIVATLRAVLALSNSSNENPSGILALTNEHLIFSGIARRTTQTAVYPLGEISTIDFEHGLIASFLRVTRGEPPHETVTSYRPDSGKATAFVAAVRLAIETLATGSPATAISASTPSSASGPASASAPTLSDELERITLLHDRGALTDAEFAAAKARILEP